MKVLLDNSTPVNIRGYLREHEVDTAYGQGWAQLGNGELLREVGMNGYQVFITPDRNIPYQQNLTEIQFGIVILSKNNWPLIQDKIEEVVDAVSRASPGEIIEVEI